MDALRYVDPDNLGGLNLYAYCGNNPVMNIDPNGTFFITFLITLGIIFLVGAISGLVGTFIGDVANFLSTGYWEWSSWETYLGNAIGWGIGLVALTLTRNPAIGLAVANGLSTFSGMSLENATGRSDNSWGDIFLQSMTDAAIGFLIGKYFNGLRLPKVSSGRGSFLHVMRTQFTRAIRYGSKISFKTFLKGIAATFVTYQIVGNAIQGFFRQGVINTLDSIRHKISVGIRIRNIMTPIIRIR